MVLGACAVPCAAQSITPSQLALVVNTDAPLSVALGEYYREARQIPAANVVRVSLPGSPRVLSAAAFAELKRQIDSQLDPAIQAIAFIWTTPYAVECNAITSAMTLGFESDLCEHTCIPSQTNPWFDADMAALDQRRLRLSMLLPTESLDLGKALIDRGVRSDGTWPRGRGYLLTTSDAARSSRARLFPPDGRLAHRTLEIVNLHADSIENRRDVMFYFTGAERVPQLETLRFLPGAVADHLTSSGGDLKSDHQMSSLRWLEAGATASYGSVTEPCNYPQKFPDPAVLLKHYLAGESVIEAYWKSVAWPTQGVFIGEPLAAPYR